MRSVTSYYNGPLFSKNMARFWPIWAGYTLIWAILIPLRFFTTASAYSHLAPEVVRSNLADLAADLNNILTGGLVLTAAFSLAAAMAVFSYLYFHRSAVMMHSLPLSRKTLFFTNYLSGLAFLILPILAVSASTLAVELLYGCVDLMPLFTWTWVMCAVSLFLYSFAVFCAMFTGNLLALPVFYGILNCLVAVITLLVDEVIRGFYYGYSNSTLYSTDAVMWLTPVIKLGQACNPRIRVESGDGYTFRDIGSIEDPSVVLIYAAVALVLTLAALWVYQLRHVESAGDVVAIPIVRPIFKAGVAVCAGLTFGIATTVLLGMEGEMFLIAMMVLWTVIGAFVAEMFLRKSFRVLKSWKSAAVLGVAMALVFVGIQQDWFGYEHWTPDVDQVEAVMLNLNTGAPYDDGAYSTLMLDDPQLIAQAVDLHGAVLAEKERTYSGNCEYMGTLLISYLMDDGRTVDRRYHNITIVQEEREQEGSLTQIYCSLLANPGLVTQMYGLDELTENWRLSDAYVAGMIDQYGREQQVTLNGNSSPAFDSTSEYAAVAGNLAPLWEAVQTDIEEGNLGIRYLFPSDEEYDDNVTQCDLYLVWRRPVNREPEQPSSEAVTIEAYDYSYKDRDKDMVYQEMSITLTASAVNTLAVLEEMAGLTLGEELLTYTQLDALNNN